MVIRKGVDYILLYPHLQSISSYPGAWSSWVDSRCPRLFIRVQLIIVHYSKNQTHNCNLYSFLGTQHYKCVLCIVILSTHRYLAACMWCISVSSTWRPAMPRYPAPAVKEWLKFPGCSTCLGLALSGSQQQTAFVTVGLSLEVKKTGTPVA